MILLKRTETCVGKMLTLLDFHRSKIQWLLNFKLSPCSVCCMLFLGNYPASGFYMSTFRNTLFHLHRQVDVSRMKLG